jgi:hypothetical protein
MNNLASFIVIRYFANGGNFAPKMQIKIRGQSTTISTQVPERNGFIFLGWSRSTTPGPAAAFDIARFRPGATYSRDEDLNLYAVWRSAGIGTSSNVPANITQDGFGGWYNPVTANAGVSDRVARFVQMGWGPCLMLAIMMGHHYLHHNEMTPTTYYSNNINKFYDSGGATGTCMNLVNRLEFKRSLLISELNAGRPVVISGHNGNSPHAAITVAYRNKGDNNKDFIVIDPLLRDPNRITAPPYPFPTTFAEFKVRFKEDAAGWTRGPTLQNPMFTFK